MRPARAVIRLERGHLQEFTDEAQITIQQQGAVEEEEMLATALGVAGEFEVTQAKIGMPADGYGGRGKQFRDGRAIFLYDILVRGGDIAGGAGFGNLQNQGIIQATRQLHDGAAAGTAAKDRNSTLFAGGDVHLGSDLIGITHNDKHRLRLPKYEGFVAGAGLTQVQQGFIRCEVPGG